MGPCPCEKFMFEGRGQGREGNVPLYEMGDGSLLSTGHYGMIVQIVAQFLLSKKLIVP